MPISRHLRGPVRVAAVVALLCLVVLTGLTKCAAARTDDRRVFSGAQVLAVHPRVAPGEPVAHPGLADPEPEPFDRRLAGPHYSVRTGWRLVTDGLDAEDARKLGVQPVRAADGEQLLLVGADPLALPEPFDEPAVARPRRS